MATIDFTTLNTNKTPDKKGQQYLDKQEVENAKKIGCAWAKEGQTEVQFNNAMRVYHTNLAHSNPVLEAQNSIFNKNHNRGITEPNSMFVIPGSMAFGGTQAGRLPQ